LAHRVVFFSQLVSWWWWWCHDDVMMMSWCWCYRGEFVVWVRQRLTQRQCHAWNVTTTL